MRHSIRFDVYEVDLPAGQLYKRGVRIGLRDKSFQVLATLLEHPGEVVTREELHHRLWRNDVFVDFDNNLNTAIARLRDALGDSADHPRYIETLPKRGYRFLKNISGPRQVETVAAKRVRLAVLPFVNMSGDPAQEYFSDAMTDEIITALASIAPEYLAVIARTTAMRYKDTHKDVARIGRELNVDYVVEGGVSRTEDHVCVNVQLIQVSDQTHLVAKKYDADMRDIFSVHSCIALALARHLPSVADAMRSGVALHEQVRRKPTEDLVAYNEYIKGRHELWKYTAESLTEARRYFEAALARDPQFALACNALAELYWSAGFWGYVPSRQADPVGRSYALRSLQIDPRPAETHVFLSLFPRGRSDSDDIDYYDWEEIQREVARARELDPTLPFVRIRHAMVQAILGHLKAAIAELERTLECDPLSLHVRAWLSMMLHLDRNFDRALQEALLMVDLEPQLFVPYHTLGYVYLGMRMFDQSATAFQKSVELSGELPIALGLRALALGLGGHRSEAQAVLERLHGLAGQRCVYPTCFAWAHLGLGEIDEAFVWMDRAIDAPDRHIEPIKTWPFLDPLRDDPRFHALLRKMNLEP
jgi:TolB-like protein